MINEFCIQIQQGAECIKNDIWSMQYYGNQEHSASGHPCLHWDDFYGIPELNSLLDISLFPDASLDEASNKCR